MPPRNPTRLLLTETALAERVMFEREQRGWTYDGLAKRMTDVGCPINQSALYKIEKAEPRRRITVDELVAFASVLETSVEELLTPMDLLVDAEALRLLEAVRNAEAAVQEAHRERDRTWKVLSAHLRSHPAAKEAVLKHLRSSFPEGSHWPADLVDELMLDTDEA